MGSGATKQNGKWTTGPGRSTDRDPMRRLPAGNRRSRDLPSDGRRCKKGSQASLFLYGIGTSGEIGRVASLCSPARPAKPDLRSNSLLICREFESATHIDPSKKGSRVGPRGEVLPSLCSP